MILAPSILAADFARLGEEIAAAERGGAGAIHVDVMDGHFVPNLTIGPDLVKSLRRATTLPLDCHLMIENADDYIDAFSSAGADWISLHVEALPHLGRSVARVKELGRKVGVAINPATPLSSLEEILPSLDYVLIMSVNPGFAGQSFIPQSLDKVARLREQIARRGLDVQIEVDGGIGASNVADVTRAGAELIVAGSAVFGDGAAESNARRIIEAAT